MPVSIAAMPLLWLCLSQATTRSTSMTSNRSGCAPAVFIFVLTLIKFRLGTSFPQTLVIAIADNLD
ncbi:hypothetical protein [Chamaesiphon polymorphus]|uniref:hypothetical protein n=1 Tax=Chamaesiphon polymorphus TaxID=2107691 RepID=UPI0015E78754|nr:hypothetical protein [Chamaesiphon polymorphus]